MNKVSEETLRELYIENSLPMHTIAKELNISIATVHKYLHKYNIPTRDQKTTFTFKGRKMSEESLLKISQGNKGKIISTETRSKISKAHYGKRMKNEWNGHKKKRCDGYIGIYQPEHPNANKDLYVMEHQLVMEKYLGRYLISGEVVHHINHKRNDNRIENLMIFKNSSDHMKYHSNLKKYLKECC